MKAKCAERLKAVETVVLEARYRLMNLEVRFKRDLYSKYDRFLTTQMTPQEKRKLEYAKGCFLSRALLVHANLYVSEANRIEGVVLSRAAGNKLSSPGDWLNSLGLETWFNPAELEDERLIPIIEKNDEAITQLIRCFSLTDYFVHITESGPLLSFPARPNTNVLFLEVPLSPNGMTLQEELVSARCIRITFTNPTLDKPSTLRDPGQLITFVYSNSPRFLCARSIQEISRQEDEVMLEVNTEDVEAALGHPLILRPEQVPLINRDASKVKEPGHITMCL